MGVSFFASPMNEPDVPASTPARELTLAAREVAHHFGDVRVLEDVSAVFSARRVHALLGENGAGKSTLLRIAAGLLVPTQGRVSVEGAPVAAKPFSLVAYVEQHAALFESLSIFENVLLGPARQRRSDAMTCLRAVGLAEHDGPVARLSLAERQLVLLARAMHQQATVFLLDEPTALATPAESKRLYAVLRRLADAGSTVVVVTHHLEEVLAHADDVTVLRKGHVAACMQRQAASFSEEGLLAAMFGAPPGSMRLDLIAGEPAGKMFDAAGRSVAIYRGEILAVAGMAGQGQDEVVAALRFGGAGTFRADLMYRAVVLPADRHHDAMVPSASVATNAMLGTAPTTAFGVMIDDDALVTEAQSRLGFMPIAMPSIESPMTALSGGNQQKVVLSRLFGEARASENSPCVLVVAEPTRGIDASAARAVHEALASFARDGHAVVLVTSDWRELRLLASRFVVLWKHGFASELPRETSDDTLSLAMLSGGEGIAP